MALIDFKTFGRLRTRQYTIKNNDKRVASARPTYLVTRHGGANTVNLILDGSCECRIHRHLTQCQQRAAYSKSKSVCLVLIMILSRVEQPIAEAF